MFVDTVVFCRSPKYFKVQKATLEAVYNSKRRLRGFGHSGNIYRVWLRLTLLWDFQKITDLTKLVWPFENSMNNRNNCVRITAERLFSRRAMTCPTVTACDPIIDRQSLWQSVHLSVLYIKVATYLIANDEC
jgi:hypothetical protein